MHETLHSFCQRYGVTYDCEPRLLPHSRKSWLLTDTTGRQWVAKPNQPDDQTAKMLRDFTMLHPHFRHPRPLSKPDDCYLLYPYIRGEVLASGPFDKPEVVEAAFEVIGRFRAMMRSLNLVPFLEEKLKKSATLRDAASWDSGGARHVGHRPDPAKPMPTRLQIAGSFQWARKQAERAVQETAPLGLWPQAPLEVFRELLDRHLSIHIPVIGNNLSHTAVHPEHILRCDDGGIGLVGWHIEPRPRFYMNHTYLAWAILRSETPFILAYCRDFLAPERTGDFHKDHQLVFALCLLEQLAEIARLHPNLSAGPFSSGITLAEALFCECVDKLG